ncbi:MAG: hypothetical protein KGI38_00065 [Thaumarchaeota archaeon]|nr:hypothetical protein [Nitrososphaerota archaeon]
MKRLGLLILAAFVIFLALVPASFAFTSKSLSLSVYPDGYVTVKQVFAVDQKTSSVQVPLISGVVSNLVATDQNGSPLSYGFGPGQNITVYTLGATSMTLRYDTNTLTSKNGTVWILSFDARYNSTIVLPQFSTLGYVSGTPYSINETNNSPELRIPSGSWRIGYGVSLSGVTTTTTGTQQGVGPGGPLGPSPIEIDGAVVAVAVIAGGFAFRWWRKQSIGPISGDLRPDDVQVLNFIQEKGGKVLEPEIRMRFALPKTSAWRQIKRLERLGYVKVTKLGSQNQIEILKERNPGA